jgi:hypothetical protein
LLVETHSWLSDLEKRRADYEKSKSCEECLKHPQRISGCGMGEEIRKQCMNFDLNSYQPPEPPPLLFLFNWDEIPEDNTRLKQFLIESGHDSGLVETAEIEKLTMAELLKYSTGNTGR